MTDLVLGSLAERKVAGGRKEVSHAARAGVTVLFCGEEFARGFQYCREALAHEPLVQVISCPRAQLEQAIVDADIAVPLVAALNVDLLSKAKKLKLILQFGVGLEGIDIEQATRRGVWVSNIPSNVVPNALSCAEMAIYLMLACLRDAHAMAESIEERRVGMPLGQTLFGKSVLIVGFGNIAAELIPRLAAFGVILNGVRSREWEGVGEAEALLQRKGRWSELHEMLGEADIVVLTTAQTAKTRGMVDASFLAACRPGVHVINVARGGLLDYEAVAEGLRSGQIGAMGLDVQWQEPFDPDDFVAKHPRVILTPHVGGVTESSYRGMAEVVAQEVNRHLQGLPPSVQINTIGLPN